MIVSLMLVLGLSLILFVGSLFYAIAKDWMDARIHKKMMDETVRRYHPRDTFCTAARPPIKFLGSFIL